MVWTCANGWGWECKFLPYPMLLICSSIVSLKLVIQLWIEYKLILSCWLIKQQIIKKYDKISHSLLINLCIKFFLEVSPHLSNISENKKKNKDSLMSLKVLYVSQ